MRLYFDPDFQGGAWPGPLRHRDAVLGEAWVGPGRLLQHLETALGLGGRREPAIVRAAALVPSVLQVEGFWSWSAEADPLGTAERLLDLRDRLWLHGWRGRPVGLRLEQLAQVTAGVLPGTPDRLQRVAEALTRRPAGIARLVLFVDRQQLAHSWQVILHALTQQGTVIERRRPSPAPARGDLAAARGADYRASADGSLQLVRAYGPLAAAEEVAAWLAALPDLESTVIIAPDDVLDAALRRHGLPTTGGRSSDHGNVLLEVLPLALELARPLPPPQRALELVCLPGGPVPGAVAGKLSRALQDAPAVGSPDWTEALAAGLERLPGERRQPVRQRLEAIFQPAAADTLARTAVEARLDIVEQWLTYRLDRVPAEPEGAPFRAALGQVRALGRLLELTGLGQYSQPQLRRLVEAASSLIRAAPPFPAEAGLPALASPAALVGPARRVVWWAFAHDRAPRIERSFLNGAERQALAVAGVVLPEPAADALHQARRWRRPLEQTTDCLLLVCPERAANGERQFPHPLWDELVAREHCAGRRLVRLAPRPLKDAPATTAIEPMAPPAAHRGWRLSTAEVPFRGRLSPNSFSSLAGCSFRYAMTYAGGLWPGRKTSLPTVPQQVGELIHRVVGGVLLAGPATPGDAAREAARRFDAEGPRLAAQLFAAGREELRGEARRYAVESARELSRLLRQGDYRVRQVEASFCQPFQDFELTGRADLVLGPAPAIVDLKLRGAYYKRRDLERGVAHQLAIYAWLARDDQASQLPPVAYFILQDQRLLTVDPEAFPGAEQIDGPAPAKTMAAVALTTQARRTALQAGELEAPGNPDARGEVFPQDDALERGRLVLRPPCRWCDHGALCGRRFGPSP